MSGFHSSWPPGGHCVTCLNDVWGDDWEFIASNTYLDDCKHKMPDSMRQGMIHDQLFGGFMHMPVDTRAGYNSLR
jgi:hypothetical protein